MVRFCIAAVVALVFSVAPALAQTVTPAPNGYKVPGCTYYVIDVRTGKMTKYCDIRQTRDTKLFWEQADRWNGGGNGAGGGGGGAQ